MVMFLAEASLKKTYDSHVEAEAEILACARTEKKGNTQVPNSVAACLGGQI